VRLLERPPPRDYRAKEATKETTKEAQKDTSKDASKDSGFGGMGDKRAVNIADFRKEAPTLHESAVQITKLMGPGALNPSGSAYPHIERMSRDIDAANEHPVEQVAALTLHWVALHIVAHTAGLHVAAVAGHFACKALGACFNHTGYDVQLSFAGVDYSVRAHEMHHRQPNTNFAQYVMGWDRLMGTYKPYDSGLAAGERKEGLEVKK
jgi:hypothetical protein